MVWSRPALRRPAVPLLLAGLLLLGACQTAGEAGRGPAVAPAVLGAVYSGYFVWDSERGDGAAALQCIRLVLTGREVLPDGRLRYTGVSRYVVGPDSEVTFATAELLFDPAAGRFEMRESDPTGADFVTDGVFRGQMRGGGLFLDGLWESEAEGGQSGRLQLRSGADAPCRPDGLA
jgi:hypothetical protein